MARTLNPVAHATRREEFVDVARRLIAAKGYANVSIDEVLAEAGASKGAFYHYFDSKGALLDAVVDRLADDATALVTPVLADRSLEAPAKLQAIFAGIARLKAANKELVLAFMDVWLSDHNAIVREKTRRLVEDRLRPWLDVIVRQGVEEGVFEARHPDVTARLLVSLVQGAQEMAGELWVARQRGEIPFADVARAFDAYRDAFDRVLGAPPGTLRFVDEDTLRFWYG